MADQEQEVLEVYMGTVGYDPKASWNANTRYEVNNTVLYNHDMWGSLHDDNIGNVPVEGEHWTRMTEGGQHAYEQGELAKQKGENARLQGNKSESQGNKAELQGNTAELQAKYAKIMAENPPKVGKTIAGHSADDNWWYYFVPNEDFTGGTYVRTDVYAKGDNLDFNNMTEAEKQRLVNMILENLSFVSDEEAHAIWNNYVFATTD